jgi:hypothetical protein
MRTHVIEIERQDQDRFPHRVDEPLARIDNEVMMSVEN